MTRSSAVPPLDDRRSSAEPPATTAPQPDSRAAAPWRQSAFPVPPCRAAARPASASMHTRPPHPATPEHPLSTSAHVGGNSPPRLACSPGSARCRRSRHARCSATHSPSCCRLRTGSRSHERSSRQRCRECRCRGGLGCASRAEPESALPPREEQRARRESWVPYGLIGAVASG